MGRYIQEICVICSSLATSARCKMPEERYIKKIEIPARRNEAQSPDNLCYTKFNSSRSKFKGQMRNRRQVACAPWNSCRKSPLRREGSLIAPVSFKSSASGNAKARSKINFGLTQVLRYQRTRTRFTSDKPVPRGGSHITGIDPGEAVNRVLRRGNLLICSEGIGGISPAWGNDGKSYFRSMDEFESRDLIYFSIKSYPPASGM
jgi:hypothetical protein